MGERRDFRLLLIGALPTLGSFGLLLPVVPLWAKVGGTGPAGVGATNFAFLMITVAAQIAVPRTLRLIGHRESLVLGGVLLGLPVFAYPFTTSLPALMAISALRGVGFALVVVTGSALVARLLPANRRGRGVGQYGLAIGLPNVLCLPTGPWLSEHLTFPVVFAVGGVLPLLGAAIALPMRVRTRERHGARPTRDPSAPGRSIRAADLVAPFLVMCCAALASSAYVTFLPAALDLAAAATVGLLGYSIGVLAGRWFAGVRSDRHRRPMFLAPGVVLAGVGLLILAATTTVEVSSLALIGAAGGGLVFGVGFGAVQNTTLTAMFNRVDARGYDVASTAWNMSFDAGTGLGSLVLGLVAGLGGYAVMFGSAAALLVMAVPVAIAVGRSGAGRAA